jgi:hypothetical protein
MKLRSRTISVLSAIVTLASAGGLVALYAPSEARAAGDTDSAVTVKWAGGNGELQQFQPDRSDMVDNADGSGHWEDFKDLDVTVSQTEGLIDQVVTVTASGMGATSGSSAGGRNNFLQVMQCWGDPRTADFAETCQFGGFSSFEVGGSGSKPMTDLFGSLSGDLNTNRGGQQFQAVTGQVNEPVEVPVNDSGLLQPNTGLGSFFTASSSNELPFVPIAADGTATISTIVQSGAAQPYLGCGDPEAAGERCWLVVVPRGTHSGSLSDGTKCGPPALANNTFGAVRSSQTGSPLSGSCSFWDNRVVVPLDFLDPFGSCPPGAAERGVAGSEVLADVMSSWQPSLCAGDGGATFNLTTNSGNLIRSQLLTGQADFAAVGRPLTRDTIGTADPELLAEAELGYAPLVNSALTIGFIAEGEGNVIHTDLRLTPRLIAKMLSQSYRFDIPREVGGPGENSESYEVLKLDVVVLDEEWIALGNPADIRDNVSRGVWVVSGPRGDDVIELLWEYVQADADAAAFLSGEPDPWGNVVNPYYLPADHPRAAGGGYPVDLSSELIDTFPKADRSIFPDADAPDFQSWYFGKQIDSTGYLPYSETLEGNARRIARVDSKLTITWDREKFSGANIGFFVDSGPRLPGLPGGRFILGPALAASAELYGLETASLPLPLDKRTTADTVRSARNFVDYSEASVSRAVEAASTDERGLTTIDLRSLPDGAYPLTTTIHAAVDLSWANLDPAQYAAEQAGRADYAGLMHYAATDGNVVTGERGGLPEGYVPLTAEQQEAALDLGERLLAPPRADTDPDGDGPDSDGPDGDGPDGGGPDGNGGGAGGTDSPGDSGEPGGVGRDADATVPVPVDDDGPGSGGPPSGPGADGGPGGGTTTQIEAAATEDTAPLAASVALGGTLIAGLAGMVGAPFLMRRRDLTG